MSRAKRTLPILLIAAVLAIVFLPRRSFEPDDRFAAGGVVLRSYTDAGDLSWEVEAQSGEVIDGEGTLTDVVLRFLSGGVVEMRATADRFARGEETSTLSGTVRIERKDGLRLATEEMSWYEQKERLEAGPIELEVRNLLVTGEHFEYDLAGERATITGDVRATARSEGDDYRCDRIETDEKTVRMIGSVEARFREGGLTADDLRIDEGGLTATGDVSLRLDLAAATEEDRGTNGT